MRKSEVRDTRTLGEMLVREGLAGHFVRILYGNSPEPWECAVDAGRLQAYWPDKETLDSTIYDEEEWFFGKNARYPRWLGYTLGYAVVGRWIEANKPLSAQQIIDVPAGTVLDTGL